MNILHINKFHYLRGGAEVVYFNTAHILEAHGHRSVFFSMHHLQNLPCETSDFFLPYLDLNTNNNIINQFEIMGRVLYSCKARYFVAELLDKYPVDIAHIHNIYHHVSPSILYELKKRNIPVVMTLHDYKMVCASYLLRADGKLCEECHDRKYFKALKKKCVKGSFAKTILNTLEMYLHHKVLDIYKNVDIFISPSRFLKDKLFEMGFKKNIIHLPNYVDVAKFKGFDGDVNEEKIGKEKSIVYFGRLSPEKGLLTLIEAARLLGSSSNVQIKIIGDGPLKESLEHRVRSLQLKNVRFLGYMKGDALYNEIKNSMFAVLPSEWYENNPMSIIEAFILGLPVIGARIGGIPELVKDKETGLTFEPGNADDLCSKMEYFINNSDKIIETGKNARALIEKELNAEKYYQKLMQIYEQVI